MHSANHEADRISRRSKFRLSRCSNGNWQWRQAHSRYSPIEMQKAWIVRRIRTALHRTSLRGPFSPMTKELVPGHKR
jgi:hypothetical protein